MKIISLLYIFALFVILTPNIFISYDKQFGVLLHTTLFLIIFYFTYDGVLKEGFYEREINVNGMGYLADLFDENRENEETSTVIINNQIRKPKHETQGNTDSDDLLKITLQKMTELRDDNISLEQTLSAYRGDDSVVDKLRDKQKQNEKTIEQLMVQVQSLQGTTGTIGKLNNIISELQSKNNTLNLKLLQQK